MKKIITDFTLIVLAFLSGFLFNGIITRINDKFGNSRLDLKVRIYTNEVVQVNEIGEDCELGDSYA